MPLTTRKCKGIYALEDESRFVFSGGIKAKPMSGVGSVRITFEKVPPLVGNLVNNHIPLAFLRRCKLKFFPSLLRDKKILFTTIPNVINTIDTFPIEIDSLRIRKAIFKEIHALGPPKI